MTPFLDTEHYATPKHIFNHDRDDNSFDLAYLSKLMLIFCDAFSLLNGDYISSYLLGDPFVKDSRLPGWETLP